MRVMVLALYIILSIIDKSTTLFITILFARFFHGTYDVNKQIRRKYFLGLYIYDIICLPTICNRHTHTYAHSLLHTRTQFLHIHDNILWNQVQWNRKRQVPLCTSFGTERCMDKTIDLLKVVCCVNLYNFLATRMPEKNHWHYVSFWQLFHIDKLSDPDRIQIRSQISAVERQRAIHDHALLIT